MNHAHANAILVKDNINYKICNNFPIYGNGVMENITVKIYVKRI